MVNNILIIEDDEFLRGLISKKFVAESFNIISAIDGLDGIKKAIEEKPSLILLDLVLPNVDGFEVLTKLKEDPSTSKIPVVILSNLGQKEDIDRGMKLGAADYIVKAQFTPEEIVEKIKAILNK